MCLSLSPRTEVEKGKRQREEDMVEMHTNKREKRKVQQFPSLQPLSISAAKTTPSVEKMLESLPCMVDGVLSNDNNMQLQATTQFRELLSIGLKPPTEEVIQSGVVPRLVEFLTREDFPQLQYEATWVLTNIVSGTSENIKVVIDNGAVPIFVKLLASPSDDMYELAAWALGNIACDSTWCRDVVLGQGALIPLAALLKANDKLSIVRRATWTLRKLCVGKPHPHFKQIRTALAALAVLVHSNDEQVLEDACWALFYLSYGTNDQIQAVIEAGFVPRLVKLLLYPFPKVTIPVIRTVGNIVRGDDNHKECIIKHGALPCLLRRLTYPPRKGGKMEACWTISNLTAGNIKQKQAVIDAGLIPPLVFLLERGNFDTKKQATWAISNVTCGGSNEQIKHLVSERCIKPLCDILLCPDPNIVTVSLVGLENILKVGEVEENTGDVNSYAELIDDARGLEKIKYLRGHDNNDVSNKARDIIETYWLTHKDDPVVPPDNYATIDDFFRWR